MCGRYAITTPPEAMRRIFGYVEQPNFPPRYNVAPTQPVPVVRRWPDDARHFALLRWGLVPSWAREVGTRPLINARGETVAEKPAFRAAFRRRRCLLPADGFYEWQARPHGSPQGNPQGNKARERGRTPKQPWFIRRRDGAPMAFAGIWEHWQDPEGSELESCAIITTAANATLAPIHHRMPVIVPETGWDLWLDPDERTAERARALIAPAPDDLLEAWPVSTRVNSVANDDPDLIRPIGPSTPAPSAPTAPSGPAGPASQGRLF